MGPNETGTASKNALHVGSIGLAVQPIRRILRESSVSGAWVEVLVRPRRATASRLVRYCASIGIARELDLFVLSRGLAWLSENPKVELCSFNISGQTLSHPHVYKHLANVMDRCSSSPTRICFEVTETEPISNYPRAHASLAQLRALGVRLALDDFGTGISHMQLLTSVQFDFLKIAGEYIIGLPLNAHRKIIRGVVAMAKELDIETIAEAVESAEHVSELANAGVNYIQGFHGGGRPVFTAKPPRNRSPKLGPNGA